MITYMGLPGDPAQVGATDSADGTTVLLDGPHGWGKDPRNPNRPTTALAILTHHLGDAGLAKKYATRFLWRALVSQPADKPFTLTTGEIAEMMKEMQGTEAETRKIASTIAGEVAPMVSDTGGAGSVALDTGKRHVIMKDGRPATAEDDK